MKIVTVFHPTTFCNLHCKYCWSPNKEKTVKLPLSVVEKTLKQIYSNPGVEKCDFLWLTGEPLVLGLDYFKSAVSLCRNVGPSHLAADLIMQTNGTLIDDEWADFFAKNDFVVGVSIDGPKHIHDCQRVGKGGAGSFDATIRGIQLLIKHGVKGSALCVITKATLEISPDELFFFFHDRKIAWSYLIEARIGENVSSDQALSKSDLPKLEKFLGRLMELWGEYPSTYIRDFDQLSRRLFGDVGFNSDYNNLGCLDILNVTAEGEFFWGNPELMSATEVELKDIRFSLSTHDLWGSRETQSFRDVEASIHQGIAKCHKECDYFAGCQGGNPAHKFYQHGRFDVSDHLTCQLNDQVIPHLLLQKMERAFQTV